MGHHGLDHFDFLSWRSIGHLLVVSFVIYDPTNMESLPTKIIQNISIAYV